MSEENIIKKIPPHDSNAERSVISSMLMDKDAISEVGSMLLKEDFYNPQYGILFEAIVKLYNEGRPVDDTVLGDKLREMGAPETISNLGFLGEILASNATAAFAKEYAEIVKEKSYSRKLIKLADTITASAFEGRDDIDNIMENGESELFALMQQKSGTKDFESIDHILSNVVSEIEKNTKNKGKINGLRTGFTDLDNALTGLHGGELILIAARPAMGKTAFVLNIANHVALEEKVPVVMFDEWLKIIESTDEMSGAPLYIDDNSGITLGELRTKCRKLAQTKGLGLIIIDYLQLMNASKKVESRQLFIAEVSRALKGLAKELDVPIIALSQLNRAADSRTDHRPVLADLRESGAIEQDADIVMFIYRDDYYNPDTTEKPGIAEIIVAKQRNGSTGTIELVWMGNITRFANLSYESTSASSGADHQS